MITRAIRALGVGNIIGFVLAAPFFLVGIDQFIGIFNDVDVYLGQYGASTYEVRSAIGQGTKETISGLAKIGVETVQPSALGERLDVFFISSNFKELFGFADPVVSEFNDMKSSILSDNN